MSTIERDGVSLYFEDHGKGVPVLWTHGFAATCRMWDPQIDALSSRFRNLVWDMRGHGQTGSPDDPGAYSHDATIADMCAILDACRIEKAVIAGLSLGGFMSLYFHLHHPERVRALMLFDTGPGFRSDDARAEWNRYAERSAKAFEEKGLAALGDSPEAATARHRGSRGIAHAARGMLVQSDARVIDSLPSIAVPALVAAGAEDTVYVKSMDYMVSKIPGAVRLLVEDAGHAPNLERPGEFNDAVASFLDSV